MSEGLYERSIMIEPAYAGNVFGELDCFASVHFMLRSLRETEALRS